MSIDCVVDDVGLPALIPLKCRILPFENFAPGLKPFQFFRHVRPERLWLLHRTLVFPGIVFKARLFFEECRRMEFGLCMQKLFNSTLGMGGCRHGR